MADHVEPLEDLLANISQAGVVDSSGEFTLNRAMALDKLAQFQLQSSSQYVLKLIQAAIAAGASQISVNTYSFGGRSVTLLCDVNLLDGEFHVDKVLFSNQPGPDHWRDLALGLNAALALELVGMEVLSWDGDLGWKWAVGKRGQMSLEPLNEGPAEVQQTRIFVEYRYTERLRRGRGLSWDFPTDNLSRRTLGDLGTRYWNHEAREVWERCLFAPIPIIVDGRSVNRPFFGTARTHSLLSRSDGVLRVTPAEAGGFFGKLVFWLGAQPKACVPGPSEIPRPGLVHRLFGELPYHWVRGEGPPFEELGYQFQVKTLKMGLFSSQRSQFLCLGEEPEVESLQHLEVWGPALPCFAILGRLRGGLGFRKGWLALLKQGVVLTRIPVPSPELEGWRIVADASNLDFDVSGFGVIVNERFEKFVERLVALTQF